MYEKNSDPNIYIFRIGEFVWYPVGAVSELGVVY